MKWEAGTVVTNTAMLEPIADLADWSDETLRWHLGYYSFEQKYDAIWTYRVNEIAGEIARRNR